MGSGPIPAIFAGMRAFLLPLVLGASSAAALIPAAADQNEPALDDLFAQLQAPEGDAAETEARIEALWYRAPESGIAVLFERAVDALNAEDPNLAAVLASHINGLAPSYAEGWILTGHVRSALGDGGGASRAYAEALRLEPRHYVALARLGDLAVEAGDKQAGLERYREALLINPHMDGVRERADRLRKETRGQEI